MNRTLNFLFLLFVSVLPLNSIKAQLYLGYDIGISKYSLSDQYFGENYYNSINPEVQNLNLKFQSEKRIVSINFNRRNIEMSPVLIQTNYYSTHYVKLSDYEISLEYLSKDKEITNSLFLFLGGSVEGSNFHSIRKINSSNSTPQSNSRERTTISLSLEGLLEYKINRFSFSYGANISFLSFMIKKNKADQYVEDSEFKIVGFNEYLELENSFNGNFELSERIILRSELLITYINYMDGDKSKILNQAVLIGGMVRLW